MVLNDEVTENDLHNDNDKEVKKHFRYITNKIPVQLQPSPTDIWYYWLGVANYEDKLQPKVTAMVLFHLKWKS